MRGDDRPLWGVAKASISTGIDWVAGAIRDRDRDGDVLRQLGVCDPCRAAAVLRGAQRAVGRVVMREEVVSDQDLGVDLRGGLKRLMVGQGFKAVADAPRVCLVVAGRVEAALIKAAKLNRLLKELHLTVASPVGACG